jgi:hypothetical protein
MRRRDSTRSILHKDITPASFFSYIETMVGNFRVSKGWRILTLVFQPLLFLFFLFIGLGMAFSDGPQTPATWFITFLFLFIAAASMYSIIDVASGRFVISESSISHSNSFRTRTLAFSEIKGYSRGAYAFVLKPNVPAKKRIRISTYVGEYERLASWAEKNFPDLNEKK